jgi:peroxiredoxin
LKRKLKTGLVVAFIAALLWLFIRPDYRQGEASMRGRPAKNFQFTMDGKPETLASLRGKVVILNFWATWCPPCIEETPSLVVMQERLKAKGITVVAVSVDVDESAYRRFLKEHGVNLLTVRDPDQKASGIYGTFKFPETYVIDRNGVMRRKFIGAVDWTEPEITDFLSRL